MKFLVAVTLVVATVVSAESPNQSPTFQRQTSPSSYQPRGWRPNGPALSASLRLQRQEQVPEPAPSYGPPPSVSYGPPPNEPTTTEQPTTTETEIEVTTLKPQAENVEISPANLKAKSAKLEKEPQNKPGPVFVILPQGSSLFYAASPSLAKTSPLVGREAPKDAELVKDEPKLAPVEAVPAPAKIQAPVILAKYEQVPQLIQLQELQAVPVARYASSLSQTSVYTPYSASYVQVFQ